MKVYERVKLARSRSKQTRGRTSKADIELLKLDRDAKRSERDASEFEKLIEKSDFPREKEIRYWKIVNNARGKATRIREQMKDIIESEE